MEPQMERRWNTHHWSVAGTGVMLAIRRCLALVAGAVAVAGPAHAEILQLTFQSPQAAQYYGAQAYAELKNTSGDGLAEEGFTPSSSAPIATLSASGTLVSGGTSMGYSTFSAYDGFGFARTSASIQVTNSSGFIGGYNAVASQGARTQVQLSAPTTPGRVEFTFAVTGSESEPVGTALGRLDFLVRPFAPGNGSFFDVFLDPAARKYDGTGTFTYDYTGSIAGPVDILFYSAAGVFVGVNDPNSLGLPPVGSNFSLSSNYANTVNLTSIAVFDESGDPIPEWSLVDLATDEVVFTEAGRLAAVPAPPALWLLGSALMAFGIRAGRNQAPDPRKRSSPAG